MPASKKKLHIGKKSYSWGEKFLSINVYKFIFLFLNSCQV